MPERLSNNKKTRPRVYSLRILAGILWVLLCQGSFGAPSITGFSPSTGRPGTVITISGSNLSGATNVSFNHNNPTPGDFVVNANGTLTVVVPIGAMTGPLDVKAGGLTGTSSSSFTVSPLITGFNPASGVNPEVVYIYGANFITGGTTVTFAGTSPVNGTVTATTVVAATVPTGAVTGPITVTTTAGSTTSSSNFVSTSAPSISDFSPAAGPTGTTVTINGANFFSPVSVAFGGVNSTSVNITSATQISAVVPSKAVSGLITVTTQHGTTNSATSFQTGSQPIITGFSPQIGTTNPPTPVEITGYNLTQVTSVEFDGALEEVAGGSGTNLQVNLINPNGTNASDSGPITVFWSGGKYTTSSNISMGAGPVASTFEPTEAAPNAQVVITGINLTSVTNVKFGGSNGISASSFSATSQTQLSATVPFGALSGPIYLVSAKAYCLTSSNFTVAGNAPIVQGFSPTNGVQGTVVTLTGTQFTAGSSVQFNGAAAANVTSSSTQQIFATVPSGATTGFISVKNNFGSGSNSSMFYLQPWITNFTSSGVVNSPLVIQGRSLTNCSSLLVNGVTYTNFTNSPFQIVASVPSNATVGPIVITTPGGIFITTNSFTVLPKIYSFTPNIGPPGTVVTINGTSLFNVTSVLFSNASATPYNVTTNQLQVNVPAGARPGPITVVTPYGQDTSSNIFTATYSSTVNLSKSVNPIVTAPSNNVIYTLLVTNLGPSIVTSVTVTDTMPAGFKLSSSMTSLGTLVTNGNNLIANIGILTNNKSATITVQGTYTNLGSLTNQAFLGFAEGETIYGTNYAFAYVYFINDAQKTLSIARATNAGKFILSWPYSTVPFTLEVNTNLIKSNSWTAVTNPPFMTTNGYYEYTNVYPANADEFFRLQGP
jgi:hypothetical protein